MLKNDHLKKPVFLDLIEIFQVNTSDSISMCSKKSTCGSELFIIKRVTGMLKAEILKNKLFIMSYY